jgi:O-acetyl-ADP-ribose deacetylase
LVTVSALGKVHLSTALTSYRRFFPSTEPEPEEDWEEVEGGESAENGPAEKTAEVEGDIKGTDNIALPDVPSGEPTDEGRAAKKQKSDDMGNV